MLAPSHPSPEQGGEWTPDVSIVEDAPLPMVIVAGADHIVHYVNPAFCRLLERGKGELVGTPFSRIVPKNDKCLTLLGRVFRTGMPASHTEEEHSTTHPLFWSYTMWAIAADQGCGGIMIQVTETAHLREKTLAMNEALILGSVRQHELAAAAVSLNEKLRVEIADRKQAEEALREAQDQLTDRAGQLEGLVSVRTAELTATNRQLEAFVYSIAHDLRAPLRAMQAYSSLLLEEPEIRLDGMASRYADRIGKSAQFMDAMLIDLLAFSRVSQQNVELNPVSLDGIVESVLSRYQMDIEEKGARVEYAGPWPAVWAHEPMLVQVLSNLVGNALKFVRSGVAPVIRLWTEPREDFTRVWVADEGLGIAPSHQAQIFRLFTRLDGEKYGGTGVGLAIVQKGIERMGGQMGVDSVPGEGSHFWFELRNVT